jgi:hypothetical protein
MLLYPNPELIMLNQVITYEVTEVTRTCQGQPAWHVIGTITMLQLY